MVGGGSRKDHGLPAISSTNIFAALESRRRKSSKKKLDRNDSIKSNGEKQQTQVPPEFWAPSLVSVKSWADVEDDDDYYETTAPPPSWTCEKPTQLVDADKNALSQGEETEGDEDADDEVDDDVEEDADVEAPDTISVEQVSLSVKAPATPVVREPERQLSKKELKKKELAELDAVLAELGLSKISEDGNDSCPVEEKQSELNNDENGEVELKASITESKNTKRRKAKKEKSFKEGKDGDIPISANLEIAINDEENGNVNEEVTIPPADPKEVLKKLASLKKKRSMKDSDAAAKAVAAEASARAAKLAAAKKKEKNHYNQQPVR